MTILGEGDRLFEFAVTERLLEFFDAHRIRTTNRRNVHRWKAGDTISAANQARLHA